jgi:CBS domain-containing protein
MRIDDVMTKDVVAVPPDATLKHVAQLLVERRISGVPVVDAERRVLGVLSEGDIVAKEGGNGRGRRALSGLFSERRPSRLEARTVQEAMTSPAITAGPRGDVAWAARLMTEQAVNRLPVVDEAGHLLGIVTRADLVRAFTRSDEELARELREDVALGALWLDPSELEITVRDGEVTLAGELDTKADARLLEHFAARVPGVVSVHSELRWRREEPGLARSDPHVPVEPRTP